MYMVPLLLLATIICNVAAQAGGEIGVTSTLASTATTAQSITRNGISEAISSKQTSFASTAATKGFTATSQSSVSSTASAKASTSGTTQATSTASAASAMISSTAVTAASRSTTATVAASTSGGPSHPYVAPARWSSLVVCKDGWASWVSGGTTKGLWIEEDIPFYKIMIGHVNRHLGTAEDFTMLMRLFKVATQPGYPNYEIQDLLVDFATIFCDNITFGMEQWLPDETDDFSIYGNVQCLGNPDSSNTQPTHHIWLSLIPPGNLTWTVQIWTSDYQPSSAPHELATITASNYPNDTGNFMAAKIFLNWIRARCVYQSPREWVIVVSDNLPYTSTSIGCVGNGKTVHLQYALNTGLSEWILTVSGTMVSTHGTIQLAQVPDNPQTRQIPIFEMENLLSEWAIQLCSPGNGMIQLCQWKQGMTSLACSF